MASKTTKGLIIGGGVAGGLTAAYFGYRAIRNVGAISSTTPGTGSTSTPGLGAPTSPYGTNPSGPSKSCPSGYAPTFQQGYGWVCTETSSQILSNEQKVVAISGASGLNMSGIDQAQAVTYQKILEQKYGGTYAIVPNANGSYSIIPSTDYVGTTDPTSGSLYTGTQTLAQQANAVPTSGFGASSTSENKALYQGLANMKAAGASGQQLAEYLIYYFGYASTLAAETAASVQNTGTVFGGALPTPTTSATSSSGSSSSGSSGSGSSGSGSSAPGINGSTVPYSKYALVESQITTDTQTLAQLESQIQSNDQAIAALQKQLAAV